ncbi:hypothetical protein, partial [Mediterranea massiliensis]|uniref:hypothetical protein n=1 Tax=Mediterranea massiliensis TaxID=1841865 RepID=UPI00266B602A
ASALQAEGRRFESVNAHTDRSRIPYEVCGFFYVCLREIRPVFEIVANCQSEPSNSCALSR